jgi:hypothetical protein
MASEVAAEVFEVLDKSLGGGRVRTGSEAAERTERTEA